MDSLYETRLAIAKRLKIAREQSGLSQGQVAKILEFQRPTISEMEAGRRKVSADELVKLADIYNVSIAWITDDKAEQIDPAVELAARELGNLKEEDFDAVIKFLRKMRKQEK